jgi:hypothetical protein
MRKFINSPSITIDGVVEDPARCAGRVDPVAVLRQE